MTCPPHILSFKTTTRRQVGQLEDAEAFLEVRAQEAEQSEFVLDWEAHRKLRHDLHRQRMVNAVATREHISGPIRAARVLGDVVIASADGGDGAAATATAATATAATAEASAAAAVAAIVDQAAPSAAAPAAGGAGDSAAEESLGSIGSMWDQRWAKHTAIAGAE